MLIIPAIDIRAGNCVMLTQGRIQDENIYSYPYNPTGLELAFVQETFDPGDSDSVEWWLQQQIMHTYDAGSSIMTKNSMDISTSRARIYEVTRLKNDYNVKI